MKTSILLLFLFIALSFSVKAQNLIVGGIVTGNSSLEEFNKTTSFGAGVSLMIDNVNPYFYSDISYNRKKIAFSETFTNQHYLLINSYNTYGSQIAVGWTIKDKFSILAGFDFEIYNYKKTSVINDLIMSNPIYSGEDISNIEFVPSLVAGISYLLLQDNYKFKKILLKLNIENSVTLSELQYFSPVTGATNNTSVRPFFISLGLVFYLDFNSKS